MGVLRRSVGATSVALALAACDGILGVEDIHIEEVTDGGGGDAGADPGSGDGGVGPVGPAAACTTAAECAMPTTTPPGCAVSACVRGVCTYPAVDADGDGHTAARCTAPGILVQTGDDCDDADVRLFAGQEVECAATESGVAIVFPGGRPVGACKAGRRTCASDGTPTPCRGAVGPAPETTCDTADRDCNGIPAVDEPSDPAPSGAMNCAKTFRCNAAGRGPLYYRTGTGWTNTAGAATVWTGYAARGDFSDSTYPPGYLRVSHDGTRQRMGPVTQATPCCPGTGCPTANVFFDGAGQFYVAP